MNSSRRHDPARRLSPRMIWLPLLLAALTVAAIPTAAIGQTPAVKQYQEDPPNAGGQGQAQAQGQGQGGSRGGAAAGRGEQGGKDGKGNGKGKQGQTSGALAGANLESDDDGGLSTLAIVLIIIGVLAAGTAVAVWMRRRRDATL